MIILILMAPKSHQGAMVSGKSRSRLLLGVTLLSVLFLRFHGSGFAKPRQESLGAVRERAGQALPASARGTGNFTLNCEEKEIVRAVSSASQARDWMAAESSFAKYSGDAPPVYTAMMHAAFRCRKYREGALLYQQCRQNCRYLHEPVYNQALRIFGKLREDAVVQEIWEEALEEHDLSFLLASSRIAAAADVGDVDTAASVLDLMEAKGIPIGVQHMSSAIRACWGWRENRHKAAKYFFDLCPQFGLEPNLIIFTCLTGAFDLAPLEVIKTTYRSMRKLQIVADAAFAETYLISVLSKPKGLKLLDPDVTVRWLRDKPTDRVQHAREALTDFERDGVPLTSLGKMLKQALDKLH